MAEQFIQANIEIGEWGFDSVRKARVQVIERTEIWGYISYKVFAPLTKSLYTVSGEHLIRDEEALTYNDAYIRFISSLARFKNELSTGMLSQVSDSILPLPHQIYALNRVLANDSVRYLLADEVGLGKTIEAGLIIKELKARGLVKRILVVCPKGLVTQWHLEMQDKFQEKFHVILPEDYDTIRRLYGDGNVYERFEQVISPLDAIKPLERRVGWSEEQIEAYNQERSEALIESGWDLVIIDEAHRVAGSSTDVARYKLGSLLAKASPYLLLLTATPHSGKTEPFLRLVRLLDEEAFPTQRAIVREQVAPYIIRTEKREAIDNEGNRLFKNRITKVVEIVWQDCHSAQKELYELVSQYVAKGYNKAVREKKYYVGFLLVLMQRLVTSSTAAIRESLEKRIALLENQKSNLARFTLTDLIETNVEEILDEALATMALDLKSELQELNSLLAAAKQAEFQYLDAKVEVLMDILDRLYHEDAGRKVILFTEFVATQNYLRSFLEKQGYKVSLLNGSMNIEERTGVLAEFKAQTNVLISTDAGGEGLNLQFANVVINYDLPWNPMKIEQRIGRVDRIGQDRDVLVFNFVLKDTVENRVRDVLEEKLSLIFAEMGIDKMQDVLDSELAEVDFTDVYIKTIANPKSSKYYLNELDEAIRQQVKQAEQVRELLSVPKSLASVTLTVTNRFNTGELLREILINYKTWRGERIDDNLFTVDLHHPELLGLLQQEILADAQHLLVLNLPDLPNEKGYWSLWEFSLSDDERDQRIFPLFINHDGLFRPASGQRIWDELIKPGRVMEVLAQKRLAEDIYQMLESKAKELAYDLFLELQTKYQERNDAQYQKYQYAFNLRIEAAARIGIENIRKRRLQVLQGEKEKMEKDYALKKALIPRLKPLMLAFME